MSEFYATDPNDPDAPVILDEWQGLRPGTRVIYVKRYRDVEEIDEAFGITTITELARFDLDGRPVVTAILDDGTYEVNAANLWPVDA